MKVLKPDNLALLYRSYRFARRDTLALGMMACFPLKDSAPDRLLQENAMWPATAAAIGQDAILDEGYAKAQAEFLLYGAAYAPGGRAVEQQRVSVQIGARRKQLIVSGERRFDAMGLVSRAAPYTRMPITPQTAFGGETDIDNPAGKGVAQITNPDGTTLWPLPNVESETQPLTERGKRVTPAGFWSYAGCMPLRQRYLGACDERWLAQQWPHLPDDTRIEYLQTAPDDQRIVGYFKGDETLELVNLHPQRPLLESRLPGLRARCFINRRLADGGTAFEEIEAHAETVWLLPDSDCGIVLYRAIATVADDEASDVLHIYAEWEALRDVPQPFDDFHARFLSMLPTAVVDAAAVTPATAPVAAADAVTAPDVTLPTNAAAADKGAAAAASPPDSPEIAAVRKQAAALEQEVRAAMQKHGITEKDLAPYLKVEPDMPPPTLAQVEKMAQDLEAQVRAAMQKHNLTDRDLAPYLKPPTPEPPVSMAQLETQLQTLRSETQSKMKQACLTEADVRRLLGERPEMADALKALDALGPDPGLPLPPFPPVPASPPPAAAVPEVALAVPAMAAPPEVPALPPKLTREQAIEHHAAKRSFAGYDLCAVDLSGLDLSGACFSEALLEGTRFKATRLAGADFSQALLQDADFSAADLQNANFTQASAAKARFTEAKLGAARMMQGDFSGGDFSTANIEGATLDGATFDGATMSGLQAAGCRARQTAFGGCDLSRASFARADLQQAVFTASTLADCDFTLAQCAHAEFYGVQAEGGRFMDADLSATRADAGSRFERADFGNAKLQRASWGGAQMNEARLQRANLDDADFSRVSARGTRFSYASAKGAKFAQADLSGANFDAVNLFKGSLRKCGMVGTEMRNANLYGVDFEGTQPTLASVEGSNIERTILAFRPPRV